MNVLFILFAANRNTVIPAIERAVKIIDHIFIISLNSLF